MKNTALFAGQGCNMWIVIFLESVDLHWEATQRQEAMAQDGHKLVCLLSRCEQESIKQPEV